MFAILNHIRVVSFSSDTFFPGERYIAVHATGFSIRYTALGATCSRIYTRTSAHSGMPPNPCQWQINRRYIGKGTEVRGGGGLGHYAAISRGEERKGGWKGTRGRRVRDLGRFNFPKSWICGRRHDTRVADLSSQGRAIAGYFTYQ